MTWMDLSITTNRIDCDVVHPPLLGQVGRGHHVGQLGLVEGIARIVLLVAVKILQVYFSFPIVQVHQIQHPALRLFRAP